MDRFCSIGLFLFAVAVVGAAVSTNAAEPIRWFDGKWDVAGAPKGKLLTDNGGWWGERVWTGVTYCYENAPTSPADCIGSQKDTFGRRLLDSSVAGSWHVPVGMFGKPVVATFDFKRPCAFREVDFVATRTPKAAASVAFSLDGTNWTESISVTATSSVTRVVLDKAAVGRFLKVSYKTANGTMTYLDEIMAWGKAKVSEKYPEDIHPVQCAWNFPQSIAGAPGSHYAEAKFDEMTKSSATGVEILEVKGDPDRINWPLVGKTPEKFSLKMAQNETEARYFAIVNATRSTNTVAVSVEGLGGGVSAATLVGGVMRVTPPKRRLTAKEIFDLKIVGHEPPEQEGVRFAPLPFFDTKPAASLARRHLANPEQVLGFPDAVPLRPGEAVVLMLRFKTDDAKPGLHKGTIVAGKTRLPLAVEVVDLILPDPPVWIYSWNAFTPQFPFESMTRFDNDVQAVLDIGVSHFLFGDAKSKPHLAWKRRPRSYLSEWCTRSQLFHTVYANKKQSLTDGDRADLSNHVEQTILRAEKIGLPLDRLVIEMPDEGGEMRCPATREIAEYIKSIHPEIAIFWDPSFWIGNRFADATVLTKSLLPWYNESIDISVPYRSHLEDKVKREEIFTKPRRVNAQYAHPSRRAGRSISWSSFRYGLDGFAYWTYYAPQGNPWDIRTWKLYGYEALMVLPLENGVAVTPPYEEMREAWEDWRLLTALREAGKTEVLDALLKEFGDSFDRPGMEGERPYKCNFLKLRDKALDAFGRVATEK